MRSIYIDWILWIQLIWSSLRRWKNNLFGFEDKLCFHTEFDNSNNTAIHSKAGYFRRNYRCQWTQLLSLNCVEWVCGSVLSCNYFEFSNRYLYLKNMHNFDKPLVALFQLFFKILKWNFGTRHRNFVFFRLENISKFKIDFEILQHTLCKKICHWIFWANTGFLQLVTLFV